MYYNMGMNMNVLKKQCIFIIVSLGISLCFLFNASAMSLRSYTTVNSDGIGSLSAGFFSAVNFSNDIVSSMIKDSGVAGSKIKNVVQSENVFDVVFIPIGQTFKTVYKTIKNELKKNDLNFNFHSVINDLDYPLKIPFWQFIVFILLFRMLFNVLPRSVSVTGIINRCKACTL